MMKKQIKLKNKSKQSPMLKYSFGGDLGRFALDNLEQSTIGMLGLDFFKPKYDSDTMAKIGQASQGIGQAANKAKTAALSLIPGWGQIASIGLGAIQGIGNQVSNTQFKKYGMNVYQAGQEINQVREQDMIPHNLNYLDKVSENLIQMDGPSHQSPEGGIKTNSGFFDKNETILKKGVVGNPTPFAFSDNLKISKEVQRQLGLPTNMRNKTIADASKFIENKYETKYNDTPIQRNTKDRMKQSLYTKLMNANKIEFAKNRIENGIQSKEDMSFSELNSQYQSGGRVYKKVILDGQEVNKWVGQDGKLYDSNSDVVLPKPQEFSGDMPTEQPQVQQESPTYKYNNIEYKKVDGQWMWKSNKTGALHPAKNFNDEFIDRNNLEPGVNKVYTPTQKHANVKASSTQKSIQNKSPKLTYEKQSVTSPDYKMYNSVLFDNTSTPNLLPDKKPKSVDYRVLIEDLETRDNKLLSEQKKYRAHQDSKLDLQNYEYVMTKLPQDAAEVYSKYRVGNRDNSKGFKILSKTNNRMYNFDKNGKLTGDFEVIRGMTKGDFPNTSETETSAYDNSGVSTTPGGKYVLDPSYNTVTEEDLKIFEGRVTSLRDEKGKPTNLAVHQTYNPQYRDKFYNNGNIEDNRQSFGCINCNKEDYDNIFNKNLKANDTMYITKEPKFPKHKYGMEVNKYQQGMEVDLFPKNQTYEWNTNNTPQEIPSQYMRNYETRSKVPNIQAINGTNKTTNWTNYLDYSKNSPQNFMTELQRGELSTDFKIPFTGQKGSLYNISDYMPKEDIINSDMENRARNIKVNTLDMPDITAKMDENDKEIKDKQPNFWNSMSDLEKIGLGANALSTLGQGLTMLKKDKIPTFYNENSSQVNNIMSDRRISIQPMINDLNSQYNAATSKDNSRSWNVQRGLNTNMYNQYAKSLGELGMKEQEMNNQYKSQYAETLNNLGMQNVQARTTQEELQARTDAARQNALRGLMANTGENLSNFAFTKNLADKTIQEGFKYLSKVSPDFGLNASNIKEFSTMIADPEMSVIKANMEGGKYLGQNAYEQMVKDIEALNLEPNKKAQALQMAAKLKSSK